MEDRSGNLVLEMIHAAVFAGAYRSLIRQDQALAGGFGKLAEKHHRAATRLADEICAQAADAITRG